MQSSLNSFWKAGTVTFEETTIKFTLVCQDKTFYIQAEKGQYESLMCLISDHFPVRGFGVCYGGGCCGTCGVQVCDAGSDKGKFILSCEIMIDEELANKKVSVLR